MKDITNSFTKYSFSITVIDPKGYVGSLDILGIDHLICGPTMWATVCDSQDTFQHGDVGYIILNGN